MHDCVSVVKVPILARLEALRDEELDERREKRRRQAAEDEAKGAERGPEDKEGPDAQDAASKAGTPSADVTPPEHSGTTGETPPPGPHRTLVMLEPTPTPPDPPPGAPPNPPPPPPPPRARGGGARTTPPRCRGHSDGAVTRPHHHVAVPGAGRGLGRADGREQPTGGVPHGHLELGLLHLGRVGGGSPPPPSPPKTHPGPPRDPHPPPPMPLSRPTIAPLPPRPRRARPPGTPPGPFRGPTRGGSWRSRCRPPAARRRIHWLGSASRRAWTPRSWQPFPTTSGGRCCRTSWGSAPLPGPRPVPAPPRPWWPIPA
ncbi:basic proline-rich protein-like [Corapipo altera]|uniref:basic proline-rich protein-like n=1 Tax=Corapipo altera TaxID=415028 RepID=UPI000FD6255D|nr:basic proline-rich protein-like [Corapipo altera]